MSTRRTRIKKLFSYFLKEYIVQIGIGWLLIFASIFLFVYPRGLNTSLPEASMFWWALGGGTAYVGMSKIVEALVNMALGKRKDEQLNQQAESLKNLNESVTAMRSEMAELKTMLAEHTPLVDQPAQNGKAEHEVQQRAK